jgi:hypothetical protein
MEKQSILQAIKIILQDQKILKYIKIPIKIIINLIINN